VRLLLTRPEPEATAMAQEVSHLGHEALVEPLLEYHSLDFDPAVLLDASALIFTSSNGIRALQERADIKALQHLPILSVGAETSRRALAAGFGSLAATAQTARELAAKIAELQPAPKRAVHVTGKHQAYDLAGTLAPQGVFLRTLNVYEMTARQAFDPWLVDEFGKRAIDGAVLMSPRTAEVYISLCHRHALLDRVKELQYFCIAPSVSSKLARIGAGFVHVAAKPERQALLELLNPASRPKRFRERW